MYYGESLVNGNKVNILILSIVYNSSLVFPHIKLSSSTVECLWK